MWPGFRELQCVLAAPSVEKRLATVLHDDSGRLVDMTRVRENLFIGDEYENQELFINTIEHYCHVKRNIDLIDIL